MADRLDRVGGRVDDGHHGGDRPEEDSAADGGDGGDVELVDEEGALGVEEVEHGLPDHPLAQAGVQGGLGGGEGMSGQGPRYLVLKQAKGDVAIGLLAGLLVDPAGLGRPLLLADRLLLAAGALARGRHPRLQHQVRLC